MCESCLNPVSLCFFSFQEKKQTDARKRIPTVLTSLTHRGLKSIQKNQIMHQSIETPTLPPPGPTQAIDQKYCPWGWEIWQILTPHMSTPRDNVGLLTRSAVLARMGTLALTMIWVTSPSINTIVFSIQGSVIYLQSSLVVYVVLFNNIICCFKKSCFLLYHKELWSFDITLYICSLFGKWMDFLNYVHIIKMCFFPFDLQKSCKYKQSQQSLFRNWYLFC